MYIRSTGVIFQRNVTKEQNGFIYKTNQSWTYALSPTPESILTHVPVLTKEMVGTK